MQHLVLLDLGIAVAVVLAVLALVEALLDVEVLAAMKFHMLLQLGLQCATERAYLALVLLLDNGAYFL